MMTKGEKLAWAAMIGGLVLGGMLLLAIVLSAQAGEAVERALASDPMAHSAQRSTQVCVGMFNLGACRSSQTSTSTAIRQDKRSEQPPLDLMALACVVPLCLFVIVGLGFKVMQDEVAA